jgi:hypothetical protein
MVSVGRISILPPSTRIALWSRGRMHVLIMLLMIRSFIPKRTESHMIYSNKTTNNNEAENLCSSSINKHNPQKFGDEEYTHKSFPRNWFYEGI